MLRCINGEPCNRNRSSARRSSRHANHIAFLLVSGPACSPGAKHGCAMIVAAPGCERQGKRNEPLTKDPGAGSARCPEPDRRRSEHDARIDAVDTALTQPGRCAADTDGAARGNVCRGADRTVPRDMSWAATEHAGPDAKSRHAGHSSAPCGPALYASRAGRWGAHPEAGGQPAKMEWPMPMRLHPSLVPVLRALFAKCVRSPQLDPNWFILLWRLKPSHPPSRA